MFLFRSSTTVTPVHVDMQCDDATVHDLTVALAALEGHVSDDAATWCCVVDGHPLDSRLPLCSTPVLEGAEVSLCRGDGSGRSGPTTGSTDPESVRHHPVPHATTAPDRHTLQVVAGPTTSAHVTLDAGAPTIVGRTSTCDLVIEDPTVSRRHCAVIVDPDQGHATITDLGSSNGTWLDAEAVSSTTDLPDGAWVHLGASILEYRRCSPTPPAPRLLPVTDDPSGRPGTWTVPFNRPPRPGPPPSPAPVPVPDVTTRTAATTRLGIAALAGPAIAGIAIAVVAGNPTWALFTLLGPLMLLAGWWDQRRQHRRETRGAARRSRSDLAMFRTGLRHAGDAEIHRRRRSAPDPATIRQWIEGPSARLWERRPTHDDFLVLRVGVGAVTWTPPLTGDLPPLPRPGNTDPATETLRAIVEEASTLTDVPIRVDLRSGAVLGIVGPPGVTAACTRALILRLCTLHGPADLELDVLPDNGPMSEAARWLPHRMPWHTWADTDGMDATRPPGSSNPCAPVRVLLVTDPAVLDGHRSTVRRAMQGRDDLAMIVVSERRERLPSTCTTVIECIDAHGSAHLYGPRVGEVVHELRLDGIAPDPTSHLTRLLARHHDPERRLHHALPSGDLRLFDLLGLVDDPRELATELTRRWRRRADLSSLRWPLGVGEGGTVEFDLAGDGPHLLVAGTTGAGKSELLRSMIVGLAASRPPDTVSFVLIDFKGGSAFDELADLPHTVGVVTDLSPETTRRTLTILEAELRHRERVLLDAGAADVAELSDGPGRLVIVIDEFATLARELPGALDALVSIAQRGRSLGIHLVLATQRPSGSVSDAIRANVGARIALRLQSRADSDDVVDAPDAAAIPRRTPGRAMVRIAAESLFAVQVASVGLAVRTTTGPRVHCRVGWPDADHPDTPSSEHSDASEEPSGHTAPETSDLSRFVHAARAAATASGAPRPRKVCPPPLQGRHHLEELCDGDDPTMLGIAVADVPDEQRRSTLGWSLSEGPLVCVGVTGSGTSTALRALGVRAARRPASEVALVVFDGADRALSDLGNLPHTAALIEASDEERQRRAVTRLTQELTRRRSRPDQDAPRVVVLVDDGAALLQRWGDPVDGLSDALGELFTQGAALGIHCAWATDRLGAVPLSWQASCTQRWVFRLADRSQVPGARQDLCDPDRPSGRFLDVARDVTAHVARPIDDPAHLGALVDAAGAVGTAHRHLSVGSLPDPVVIGALGASDSSVDGVLDVPLGIGHESLRTVGFHLAPDDHAVVTGPPRSGKTSTLHTIMELAHRDGWSDQLLCVSGRRPSRHPGWEAHLVAAPALSGVVTSRLDEGRGTVVLIDDADRLPDDGHGLVQLLERGHPSLHVVAATDPTALRTGYGHFLRHLCRSHHGLLLCPDTDIDGEALRVRLPRRAPIPLTPGRGYLVGDEGACLVVVASPGAASTR